VATISGEPRQLLFRPPQSVGARFLSSAEMDTKKRNCINPSWWNPCRCSNLCSKKIVLISLAGGSPEHLMEEWMPDQDLLAALFVGGSEDVMDRIIRDLARRFGWWFLNFSLMDSIVQTTYARSVSSSIISCVQLLYIKSTFQLVLPQSWPMFFEKLNYEPRNWLKPWEYFGDIKRQEPRGHILAQKNWMIFPTL